MTKHRSLLPLWLLPVVAWPVWGQNQTSTTVTVGPNPAQIEQQVDINAVVTILGSGQAYPKGTLAFTSNGQAIAGCTALPLTNEGFGNSGQGHADCLTTFPQAIQYTIVATYSGDGTNAPSQSAPATLQVTAQATAVQLSFSPSPVPAGQPVSITAQVSDATGTPTGTVTFTQGTTTLCANTPLNTAGIATCSYTFTQAGTYTIAAAYSGDSVSAPKTNSASLTVSAGASTLKLSYTAQYLQILQPFTVTAAVSGSANPAPTGSVAFTVNGASVSTCSAVRLVNSQALCSLSCPQTGGCTIAASYSGDANNGPSTASLTLSNIGLADATPSIGSYAIGGQPSPPYYASQVVNVTAKFCQAPPLPPPTGNATFQDGSTVLGTLPVSAAACHPLETNPCSPNTSFACAYWDAPFGIGSHSVTASYAGDSNYQPSATPAASFSIVQTPAFAYPPATSPVGPIPFGEPVILGAEFLPPAGSAIAPTGTVTFYFQDSTQPGTGPASIGAPAIDYTGHAAISVPSTLLSVGTHSAFTASYGGDAIYQPVAAASPLSITVTKAPVSLVLAGTAFQNGKLAGVTAVPIVTTPGDVTPTGTVTFADSSGVLCGSVALQSGQAQCSITQARNATISVTYNGDAVTQTATASIALSATSAMPGFYVESSPGAPILGQTVTVDTRLFGPPGTAAPTGTVKFIVTPASACSAANNSASLCNPQVGADGHALLVLQGANAPALGNYSIAAVYSGDTNYQGASPFWPAPSATPGFSVGPDPTVIVIASPVAQFGQPLTLNAAVIVPSPGTASANGTVNWQGAGGQVASCKLAQQNNNVAQCAATIPSLDTYTPVVSYVPADGNTASSSLTVPSLYSPSGSHAFAGIYVTANPANVSYGSPAAITANLFGAPGLAAPGGTMTFYDNGAALGAPVAVTSSGATLSLSNLATGSHNITVSYSGDANYGASAAANNAVSVLVTKALTKLDLAPWWVQIDQPVKLKASVTILGPGTPAQDGTVDFTVGGSPIAGCTGLALDQNGAAWCTVTFSQLGASTVGAAYSGGTNTAAVAGSMQVTVAQLMFLSAYSNPVPYGAGVGIRALLMATPLPTGKVTFSEGATVLATLPVGGDGTTVPLTIPSGTIQPLDVGTHTITAVYSGDANYQSVTATLVLTVTQAATAVDLYLQAPQVDQSVKITAAVRVLSPGVATPSGTVDFANNGHPISGCTGLPLQIGAAVNGMAYWSVSCTATFSQLTGVSITATYNGDNRTSPSTSPPTTLSVGKAVAGIYLASYSATLPYGAGVGLRALLMGSPAPTGSVTFSDGATALATVAIGPDGSALLTIPSGAIAPLEPGSHTIGAAYSGDANFQAGAAAVLSITITKADTSVSVYAPAPQVNQPIALRAAVTVSAPGAATPTGTVDFTSAGTPVAGCSGLPLQGSNANGMPYWLALCNTSFSQLSGLSIAATYNGDAHTSSSTSPAASLTVGKAVAGFYTAVYNGTLPYGAGIGLQGLLLGTPTPTGTVTFSDGSSTLATVPVGPDGTAPLAIPSGSIPPLDVGAHTIGAAYSGDSTFQSATAASLSVTVTKADTAVSVYSPPPQVDQPLALKAAVTVSTPGQATPAGTVDFTNSGTPIPGCTGLSLQSALTVSGMSYWPVFCNTSFHQLTGVSIVAAYNGDTRTSASASPAMPLTVGKAMAGIYAASAPAAPVFGVPVTVSALLLGASGIAPPTGSVTFSENGATTGAAAIGSDGRASLTLPAGALAAGQHVFTASWTGDTNYAGPATASVTVLAGKAATTTILSASFGMPLTATISVMAPGAGSPTGGVQFFVNGALAGTASVTARNGVFTAALPAGSFSGAVWAVYQGDANFAGSASASTSVTPAAVVSIAADHNPATPGQSVTFTIDVTSAGATVPTGRVQVSADGVSLGAANLTSGVATLTAAAGAFSIGSHTVTAAYSGDFVYPAASATLLEVVAKSVVSLALTASPASSVYGQPVAFTAQLSATSGTIQFSDAGAPVGSAPIVAGAATLTLSTLAAGSHSITAIWTGDGTSSAASSTPLAFTVGKAQTSTILASSGMVLTAVVAVVAPGAGSPTGTVKFLDAATNSVFAASTLTAATASTAQPATADSIVALYSGDANFAAGTSTPLTPLAAANAASFATNSFAPDEIVTLFGTSLSAVTASSTANPAPSLGGASVAVTDSAGTRHAANLLFISPSQASVVMPSALPDGPAVIAITNASGATFSAAITVSRVAPGLFTADGSGKGTPVGQTIRVHSDGSQDPPQDLSSGPINLGTSGDAVYLLLYGTGIRHQTAAAASFACAACTGGDIPVAYAGAQPSVPGLDQVNLLLPASLQGAGQAILTLTLNGVASNSVTVMFR